MELTTLFVITGVVALSGVFAFAKRNSANQSALVKDAKMRAEQRAQNRAFADTVPMSEWDDLQSTEVEVYEICDKYDGRGRLTPAENEIVNLIMADLKSIPTIEVIEMTDPWKDRA